MNTPQIGKTYQITFIDPAGQDCTVTGTVLAASDEEIKIAVQVEPEEIA